MHPCRHNLKAGFSLMELLVVMAIITLLAGILLPALDRGKARARRVQCVNNLKQIGLCFHAFAHDNNSAFPISVLAQDVTRPATAVTKLGGSFYCTPEPFKALGDEMPAVRLLICPTDTRDPAADLNSLRLENLSYFVNVEASYRVPTAILVGDRNLRRDEALARRLQLGSGVGVLTWTPEMHNRRGNLLFADGSVHTENRPIMVNTADPGTNTPTTTSGSTPPEAPLRPLPSVDPDSGGAEAQPSSTQPPQAAAAPGLRGGSEVRIGNTGVVRQAFLPPKIHGLEGAPSAQAVAVPLSKLSHTSEPAALSHTSAPAFQPDPVLESRFVDTPAPSVRSRNSLWILYTLLLFFLLGLLACLLRARSIRSDPK